MFVPMFGHAGGQLTWGNNLSLMASTQKAAPLAATTKNEVRTRAHKSQTAAKEQVRFKSVTVNAEK